MIHNSGISKCEVQKINKEWVKEDENKPDETRFKWFKKYYIAKTAILAADEVQPTINHANSAMQQPINNFSDLLVTLQNDNSVLMANQEEMASAYKNGGVPAEITTNGGTSVAPGPDLTAYISQLIDDRTQGNNNSSEGSSGSNTNQNVDPRKLRPAVIWWRQFKFYCPSCGVNLNHGAKNCPEKKRMKSHDETVTWDKKETPRNKDRCDHLWKQ